MSTHLEQIISNKTLETIGTNTEISYLTTADKRTQTEPLIVLLPDDIITWSDGLTITIFKASRQIFVDNIQSEIVLAKPALSTPREPTTPICRLNIQTSANKGSQTKVTHTEEENIDLIQMCAKIYSGSSRSLKTLNCGWSVKC